MAIPPIFIYFLVNMFNAEKTDRKKQTRNTDLPLPTVYVTVKHFGMLLPELIQIPMRELCCSSP